MSWWSSWLPSLPTIDLSLPSGIQRRFISFALKRSLGHFLKPGQLDLQQVDSQIGSGYVQVRDLELSNDSINALVSGLPIQLHDGSIGKVTARIPWPNPLTSTIGLSVESPHLTFYLAPQSAGVNPSHIDLAESVASVAESFIHEELNPLDEAALRESIHSGGRDPLQSGDDMLPGGLDPFMSDEELSQSESELEPPGVSIFATLIEKLLARFAFGADDVKVTIVNPQQASFTVSIAQVRYGTEASASADAGPGRVVGGEAQGSIRGVTLSGITVTTRCLRPTSPAMTPTRQHGAPLTRTSSVASNPLLQSPPAPPSPESDSSDMDEDTQMLMSQSIAVLPPRPVSPATSVASSMYQSAVSTSPVDSALHSPPGTQAGSPPPVESRPDDHALRSQASPRFGAAHRPNPIATILEVEDETIFSFGLDPISIRLHTPAPIAKDTQAVGVPSSSRAPESKTSHSRRSSARTQDDKLRVDVEVGVVALALNARHIRSILDVADIWLLHSPPPTRPTSSAPDAASGQSTMPVLDAQFRLRGIVVLLHSSSSSAPPPDVHGLSDFFSRPLVPPKMPHGYVRVHLEELFFTMSILSTPLERSNPAQLQAARQTSKWKNDMNINVSLNLTLAELSVFVFLRQSSPEATSPSTELYAYPVLITDPNLRAQYPRDHSRTLSADVHTSAMPTFEIVDWTDPARRSTAAKLSAWRSKVVQHHQTSRQETSAPSVTGPKSPPRTQPGMPSSISPPTPRAMPRLLPSSPGQVGIGRPSITSGGLPLRPPGSAISARFRTHSSQSQTSRTGGQGIQDVEVTFEPLHVFLDLGLLLGRSTPHGESATLSFLKEVVTPSKSVLAQPAAHSSDYSHGTESDDGEDADTPPATPRATMGFSARTAEEQQQERRRLEQQVLDDLDLEYDYRQGAKPTVDTASQRVKDWRKTRTRRSRVQGPTISVKFPVIRIQIRDTPPLSSPRSGALILDVHDLHMSPSRPVDRERPPQARFAPAEDLYFSGSAGERTAPETDNTLLYAEWHRVVVAYGPVSSSRATAIVSLDPSHRRSEGAGENVRFGGTMSPDASIVETASRPYLQVRRSSATSSLEPSTAVNSLVIATDIPSIHIELSKPILDGLQFWADDLARLMDATFGAPIAPDMGTEPADSRDSSLIGSRYFAKSRSGSSQAESGSFVSRPPESSDETALKITVGEGIVRLFVPRAEEGQHAIRPFDVSVSDVDILIELKPEGKDETVLTFSVRDITLTETTKSGFTTSIITLTHPHSLMSTQTSAVKVRFVSLVVPETTAKESRIKLTLRGITFTAHPDFSWISDLASFAEAPPGAFEAVVPSERTRLSVKAVDTSLQILCPTYDGALVPYIGELEFSTVIEGGSPELTLILDVPALSLLLVDNVKALAQQLDSAKAGHTTSKSPGLEYWKRAGFALLAELANLKLRFSRMSESSSTETRVSISQGGLRLHLCADTLTTLTAFISDFTSIFASPSEEWTSPKKRSEPTRLSEASDPSRGLLSSLDEHAFRQLPEVGAAPDMIYDDLPTNPDYLDESFGAAAGLRELDDDEFDESDVDASMRDTTDKGSNTSTYGGETIRMLRPEGLQIIEHYFDTMTPDSVDGESSYGDTTLRVRLHDCGVTLLLYDGYDWVRTRRIIEEEQKEMRKKLAKIRQLVASGQTPDPSVEETNTLLFNSVYIGLEHNVDELEPGALIAAIDEELNEELETASQSSWQSLKPQTVHNSPGKSTVGQGRSRRKRLSRSKGPNIEFQLMGLNAEVDRYAPRSDLISRTLVTVEDVEILDHIKTSTWKKFLTSLRSDSRGNIRETGSNMVRVEVRTLHPVPDHPSEEARLRAKILPLRLHVDQDALDFLKKFFSFKDPESSPAQASDPEDQIYFQQAEVFPVDIKLDYKPRRVDYRALRDGRTIELMNFFHFDGAEMTLRHITLTGIAGWPRLFDLLNDLWTPDVKATQLVDVISGVSPIRSVVNVGSGVADLVLLPIAQYKKDGRVVRGLQKGTTAFVKSTAMEAIKLGARLATGTQVILEQAENVIGGQFKDPITAETVPGSPFLDELGGQLGDEDEAGDLISRYAEQPMNVQEGMQSAYRSLRRNFNSAAQTILAVPMEVYERSGNEGPVRAVVRAVPIAVLKPMIGASEAVSKTLLGLHNQLDPSIRHENEAKYKQR